MVEVFTNVFGFIEKNCFEIKIWLLWLSCSLSLWFICSFIWKSVIQKKKIFSFKINEAEVNNYVGKTSFFSKTPPPCQEITDGLKKNLRFLYSTWFYVCVCTAIISLISIRQAYREEIVKTVDRWNTYDNWGIKDTFDCHIIAEVEKDNANYERKKDITTSKDTLFFPLNIRFKSRWIDFKYPIYDTLIVSFVEFNKANTEFSKIEKSIRTVRSLEILKKKINSNKDLILKKYCTSDKRNVYFVGSKKFEKDLNIFIDSLKLDSLDIKLNSLENRIKYFKDDWRAIQHINSDSVFYFIYPLIITLNGKNYPEIEFKCKMSHEKNPNSKNIKYRAKVEEKGYIIIEDTNEDMNKIVRSDPKDSIKYQKFFNEFHPTDSLVTKLKEDIINTEKEKQNEKGKRNVTKNGEIPIKPYFIKNWYSTLTTMLSLLTNVFLLLFFGFLNTKTDLFLKKENKPDVYGLYRFFVIGIFFIILIILLLDVCFPFDAYFSPIFSSSFLFVINLIIALTSVIAIFGCWGSMSNSYTSFPFYFKFWMILYAMIHFFELNIHYIDESFNKYAEIILYLVAVVAKVLIIYILLRWAPKSKRILWYFFTSVNNYRTENDYNDFIKIFEIHELKRENEELQDINSNKELLELKKINIASKREYAGLKKNN